MVEPPLGGSSGSGAVVLLSSAVKPNVPLSSSLNHLSLRLWLLAHAGHKPAAAPRPLLPELLVRLPFGAAATVQQLVEHGQGRQRQHGEDEEQQDDEAGHVPAIVERVDLLDLDQDLGEGHGLRVPREAAGGGGGGGEVGHGAWQQRRRRECVTACDMCGAWTERQYISQTGVESDGYKTSFPW